MGIGTLHFFPIHLWAFVCHIPGAYTRFNPWITVAIVLKNIELDQRPLDPKDWDPGARERGKGKHYEGSRIHTAVRRSSKQRGQIIIFERGKFT